jgi:hypothetical protein
MDLNVINPGAPKYGVNELVCIRESALNGYIEQHRINNIEFDSNVEKYWYVFIFSKSKPNTQTVGDANDLKTATMIKLLEDDLITYEEALLIKKRFLESELIKVNNVVGSNNSLPIINVLGNGVPLVNGENVTSYNNLTNYGNVDLNDESARTYDIVNTGKSNLFLTGSPIIRVVGDQDFSVTMFPEDIMIAPNMHYQFSMKFSPVSEGRKLAVVIIESNDLNKPSFSFTIEGVGTSI